MGHMRDNLRNLEPNLTLADSAARKYVSPNGQRLVRPSVIQMNDCVDSGDRDHLSRFVSARVKIGRGRHDVTSKYLSWSKELVFGSSPWNESVLPSARC
jgi:hypothetical protein